jgi:TRAP-type C4-dicarboxylate transport system substrate-binding protein
MWEGDPIAEAAFKALSISPIPLSITDVMTSLQTGLVNGVYVSPLAAIALQWFTRVKYMYDVPLAVSAGAVLVSKKMWDKLPSDLQEILQRNGKTYMRKLTQLSREDNTKSIDILKQNSIQITKPPSAKVAEECQKIGASARQTLVGKLYSEEFLQRVEKSLADFRANQKAANSKTKGK